MYRASFINRLEQFGKVNYEIVLLDTEAVMVDIREPIILDKAQDRQEILESLAEQKINFYTKIHLDQITRDWVIEKIKATQESIRQALLEGSIDLNTLTALESFINPIREFYGLPKEQGLAPLLNDKLDASTSEIIRAFSQLPINENTIPLTNYFVNQINQALGVS